MSAAFQPVQVSLATVADYCDSADRYPALCVSNDLKDVQRPWTLKALLKLLPAKRRLLEIGAGEPLVAQALADAGHSVTVCDPYDGSGNGPTEFAQFQRRYPRITFVRSHFTPPLVAQQGWDRRFDAIYSISVLEHLHGEALTDLFSALAGALAPGGASVHCVDAVVAGRGNTWHCDMIARLITCQRAIAGEPQEPADALALATTLFRSANDDIEVFIMGPQGHNLWRGAQPYASFPFRRCASVQAVAIRSDAA